MVADVMMRDDRAEQEAKAAAATMVVQKNYYYFPAEKKEAARDELRRIAKTELFKTEDGMADVALEQLWNLLSGNC